MDEGWREERRGRERHRKRSTNHLSSDVSLGVTDNYSYRTSDTFVQDNQVPRGTRSIFDSFSFSFILDSIFSLVLVTFSALPY